MQASEALRQRIERWVAGKIPGASDVRVAPLHMPTEAGNSGETIFVDVSYTGEGRTQLKNLVLRRHKEGSELFLGGNLENVCRIMSAVAAHTDIAVPPVFALELDRSVLDYTFLVTEKIPGRIVPQEPNYNRQGWLADLPVEKRGQVWRNGLEMVAHVHATDWRKGFQFLDDPSRGATGLPQYIRWVSDWYEWANRGRAQPVLDVAMNYLRRNMPQNAAVQFMWGDSQSANMLFAPDGTVTGVLDWEIAALGPGELDLAWWLFFDAFYATGMGAERLAGLPDRAQTVAIYEEAAKRRVQNLDYYELLAKVRMAIIVIRTCDRQIGLGRIEPTSNAITNNPMTLMVAQHMGLPEPEVGADFLALVKAAVDKSL